MTPTNQLRFVEREVPSGEGCSKTVRVLQQWWEAEGWEHEVYVRAGGEWQDVLLEEE